MGIAGTQANVKLKWSGSVTSVKILIIKLCVLFLINLTRIQIVHKHFDLVLVVGNNKYKVILKFDFSSR